MKRIVLLTSTLLIGFIILGISQNINQVPINGLKHVNYTVINSYPHDSTAYTQGLVWYKGKLFEGTGLFGGSSLRNVTLLTGEVMKIRNLSSTFFGEGITIYDDKIYQLTWKNNVCFVYDISSFNEINSFKYDGEGWGLTNDGVYLIMSNGTSTLSFLNPSNFSLIKTIKVYDGNGPVDRINELEYVEGIIYANIWLTDTIIGINPQNGQVVERIDFSKLKNKDWLNIDVLNGIAYDPDNKRIFVTGKLWPLLFEVKLIK